MNNSRNFLAVIQFFALPFFSVLLCYIETITCSCTYIVDSEEDRPICLYYTSRHDKCVDLEEGGQGVPNSNLHFKITKNMLQTPPPKGQLK